MRTFNIKETCVDEDDTWLVIFAAAALAILSTLNKLKSCSLGLLVFGCEKVLPIKHTVYWKLIRQRKQNHINKNNIRENSKRVDHD